MVDNLLIWWHKPRYRKLPQSYTPHYCLCLALWLFPLALSLCYPSLAMKREKHHESSTSWEALFYNLACSSDVEL